MVGSDAVARAEIGQEAPRERVVGESENVGAIVSHVVEGDVMSLIIQDVCIYRGPSGLKYFKWIFIY